MRYHEIVDETESLTLPTIDVGDAVLVGKFKNRRAEVKGFTSDKHGQPVLKTNKGEQKLFKPRLVKLIPENFTHGDDLSFTPPIDQSTKRSRSKPKPLASLKPKDSPAFMAWFGTSKIVDRAGNPLPVFHGRKLDFKAFDPSKAADRRPNTMFFTSDPDIAASYSGQHTWMTGARDWKEGANVMPLYLRIVKPLTINARGDHWSDIFYKGDSWSTNDLATYAREKGYDGLVVKNVHDQGEGMNKLSTIIVAFSPNQVKSVFNRGGWRTDLDDVNEAKAMPNRA